MTQTDFESTLKEIAALKRELAPVERQAKELTERIELLKIKAITYMREGSIKSTEPINGYSLVRVAGRTRKLVADQDAAVKWLAEIGEDPTDYYDLIDAAVVKRAEEHLRDTGEVVDFVEIFQGPDYLTVREAKE